MKALIQRVSQASVSVDNQMCGCIEQGLLVFLGIHKEDHLEQTHWLAQKIVNLRIFADQLDKMNLSIKDVDGSILVISQFTLYADCSCSRRPEFTQAASLALAKPIYEKFIEELRQEIPYVQTGKFGAKMSVSLVNEGPVTFIVEGKHS